MIDNLQQIRALNQRGGRPLSLVDLIAANTLDLEMAATLAGAVSAGASFLTAARPGNAGKTTLMASLLAFLPPGRRIVTIDDGRPVTGAPAEACLLAHEIGAAPIYSYLWGAPARRFFEAIGPGISVASCIHADTLAELRGTLCGGEIGLAAEVFARIDLVAFLRLDATPQGYRRRVAALYASGREGHRRLFRWEQASDTFVREASPERWSEAIDRARALLERLRASGTSAFESVFAAARETSA
ncbi:MAG: hypothetical protein GX774_03730 [Armatimonadetes bacterium]|jgi:hypothetical protein|nr:hypothetical protein [Armatimonadota bacterium]